MFVTTSTLLLLVLSQVADIAAVPVAAKKGSSTGHSFSVSAVPVHQHVKNGPKALRKALAKHGIAIPEELKNVDVDALSKSIKAHHQKQKRQSVAASSNGYWDTEYTCPVSIGGQTLNLDFDTGSSDLWVFSDLMSSRQSAGHSVFHYTQSKTFKALRGYSWRISYGDGSGAQGVVGTDVVTIGGLNTTSSVELATSVSSSFTSDTANSGLLGLGFGNSNTVRPQRQQTWFENAKSKLPLPVFTANLKHQSVGSYDFGFINASSYTGNLSYAPVITTNGYWQFNAPTYKVGNVTYNATSGSTGIADTGTTLMLVTSDIATKYYAQVNGSSYSNTYGGWVFPCAATLPNLSVSVGNALATIPGSVLNFGWVTTGTCYGGVQNSGLTSMNIYGDIYFKQYFTVFDYGSTGSPRVGFAAKSS